MKCKICGETDTPGVTFINASTLSSDYVCLLCQVKGQIVDTNELEELDESIRMYEDLSQKYEELVKVLPPMDEKQKGLPAISPLGMYKTIQMALAAFRSRRMEILAGTDKESQLQYEINEALEKEDFEKAAELKKQLEESTDDTSGSTS